MAQKKADLALVYDHRVLWVAALAAPVAWGGLYVAGHTFEPTSLIMFLFIYPIAEEIVFRGWIQGGLQRYLPLPGFFGISGQNLLTSAIFSAVHCFGQDLLWALMVFFPSLIFGALKDRYNSLIQPVIFHIIYNIGFWAVVAP